MTAQKQNATLLAQLHYVDSPRFPRDYTAVNTRIIARAPSEFDQRVLIAAGSGDGLRIDTPVVTQDGLVGRVSKVTRDAAEVMLITDEESAVPARDLQTGAIGLVRHGQSQGQLILDRVPKEQVVKKGDMVVTQGTIDRRYPSLYPYGIPIGRVISVGSSDIQSYLTVQVAPFADFGSLDTIAALVATRRAPKLP